MTRAGLILVLLGSWAVSCSNSTTNAQDAKPQEPPLLFRRVIAPADRINEWPRGNQRLVPIEAEAFEKLVETLRDDPTRTTQQTEARLEQAMYRATLSADGLLTGDLEWSVRGNSPQASLTLAPCSAACSSFTWAKASSPPLMGTDSRGQLVIIPRQDGTLKATWQLRARSQSADEWTFELAWPHCVQSAFELDLPADWHVYSGEQDAHRSTPAPDMTRWRWQLGPTARLRLSIFSPQGTNADTTYRTSTQFEYANRAWEVSSNWRIDVGRVPLDKLWVEMDADLAMRAVYAGGDPLEWLQVASNTPTTRRYVIQFATPLRGYGRTLRLEAVAAATLGASHTLPRVWTEGLVWQEGTIRLQVPAPNQLRQLDTIHCRQTRSSVVPEPLLAELSEFQCFDETATLRCRLETPAGEVRYSLGSKLQVSAALTTLDASAHLLIDQSRRTQLQCTLPAEWMIESVDSIPSGRVADWSIEAPQGSTRTFSLRLKSELNSAQPLRLVLRAQGPPLSLGTRLGSAALFPLRFNAATFEQGLASLGDESGNFASIVPGPQTPLRKLDSLTAIERELLGESGESLVVSFDPRRPLGSITVMPRRGPGVVRGELLTRLDTTRIHESYRWQCEPQQSAVQRVEVLLQQHREVPLQWRVPALNVGEWTARLIKPPDDEATQGERWELKFARPLVEPFELLATRDSPRDSDQLDINLATLRDIADQRSTITVEGPLNLAVTNLAGPIHEQVVPPSTAWLSPRLQRQFEYAIVNDSDARLLPSLSVRAERAESLPTSPVVLRSELLSHFTTAGRVEHRWQLDCETTNVPTLICELPDHIAIADGVHTLVNDVQQAIELQGRRLHVPLNHHAPVVRVVITFSTLERSVALARAVAAPEVRAGDAVLSHQWTIRLGADYDAWVAGSIQRPQGTLLDAEITLPSDVRTVLLVYRTRLQMLAWSLGWIAAVLAWRSPVRPWGTYSAALLLLLVSATTPPWQQLAWMPLVGLILGRLAQRWLAAPRPISLPANTPSASNLSAAVVSLVLVVCLPSRAEAQMLVAPVNEEARVFIPVDANNQPTGRYLIGEDFLQQLRRRAAAQHPTDEGYSIRSARYRGQFTFDEVTNTWTLGSLLAELRVVIHRSQEDTPLVFDQIDTLGATVRGAIDGRHAEFILDSDHKCLRLGALESGEHLVEIDLPFSFDRQSSTTRAQLSLPRVHDAVLDLATASAAPPLEFSSPIGAIQRTAKAYQVQLGPIDQLHIAWPDQQPAPVVIDVDALVWLRLRAGAVATDMRLRVEPIAGKYRELDIAVDSRWRLLPWGEVDTPLIDVQTLPLAASIDRVRHYRLTMSQMTDKPVTIPLSFLNTATTGIGTVTSPEVTVTGARQTRRALAMTIDPSLLVELPMAVPNADDLAAFIRRWEINEAPPDRVVELASASPVNIRVQPRDTFITTTDHTQLDLHASHIDLNYRGTQQVVGSPVFRQLLQAPSNWTPRRVRVEQDAVEHAVRWWRVDPDRIELLYDVPLLGAYRLLVDGVLPPVIQPQMALPVVELLGAQRAPESTVEVRHDRDLEVTFSDEQDLRPVEAAVATGSTARAWSISGARPLAQLEVRPSRVTVEVVQVSRLELDSRQRSIQVDARWQVRDGTLNRVSWLASAAWPEPRDRQPDMTWQSFAGREPSQQVWLALLNSPVADSLRTNYRVSLGQSSGELVSFPQPLNVQSREHYVLLPQAIQQQNVHWQTTDLERAELPSELSVPSDALYTVYRVTGENPAAFHDPTRITSSRGVMAASTHLYWQGDRRFLGQTRFVMTARDEPALRFGLGSNGRLIHVEVDRQRMEPHRTGELQWEVDCPHGPLPHELIVTFECQATAPWFAWQPTHLPAVELTSHSVESMTWQVTGTADAMRAWGTVEQPLTEREWALSQAETEAGVLQWVAGQDDLKSSSGLAWLEHWADRVGASQRQAQQAIERIKNVPPADLNRLQSLRNRLQPWQEQMEAARQLRPLAEPSLDRSTILFARTSSGGMPTLMIQSSSTWMAYALRYAAWVGLLALAWHLRHHPRRLESWIAFIVDRQFIALALLGAAWWLCLEPAWLGVAIMAIAGLWHWEQSRQRRIDNRSQLTPLIVNR